MSPTDAAAVFNVFRAKGTNLRPALRHVIEAESGSNDPMAVFLTFAAINAITNPHTSILGYITHFIVEMGFGAAVGYFGGKLVSYTINHIRLQWEGLYPVLSIALVLSLFAVCSAIKGNGFLAVYIAGLVVGNATLIHRGSLLLFHDGIAWLLQIAMFLILGLQVFPSHLMQVAKSGLYVSLFLILIARPLSVLVALAPFRFQLNEKMFIAWAGLRGAAPIVLAIFAMTSGVPNSRAIFNTVFFVAVLSVAAQGTTMGQAAKWLKVLNPNPARQRIPLRYHAKALRNKEVVEFEVAQNSVADNMRIVDLPLPKGVLILLVAREDEDIVPNGSTILHRGDVIQTLVDEAFVAECRKLFENSASPE
ncbi:MAG: potassium/proton antiporter [Acidobacteria bacterium]|nr:MAG: potassium/proton antiporter [Acidobacteriota bacterium]